MDRIFNPHIDAPKCIRCDGSGWEKDKYNEIKRDSDNVGIHCNCYFENRYLAANIGFNYWELTPQTFEGNQQDLARLLKYLNNVEGMKNTGQGLYIYGKNGVGKTSLGIMLLKHVLRYTKYSAMFVPFSDLVILNSRLVGGYHDAFASKAIEVIKNIDFLVVDDIGKEYEDGKDKARATLNSILRFRDMWKKPTIYTANNQLENLRDAYGEGNYTIMYGRSEIIEMENEVDFRRRRKMKLAKVTIGE